MAKHAAARKAEPAEAALRGERGSLRAAELDRLIHERVRLGIVSALAVNDSLSFNQLKALLKTTDGSEISLAFEENELERLLDEDVEAHGIRKTLAVLTVAVGMAGAGAGSALASPASDGALPGGTARPAASTQATDQSSWSTGETAGVAAAGTILALTAAGFAVRSRRSPRVAT